MHIHPQIHTRDQPPMHVHKLKCAFLMAQRLYTCLQTQDSLRHTHRVQSEGDGVGYSPCQASHTSSRGLIGHHTQGLSLQLQLLAGTRPLDSPQRPAPSSAWACAREGAGASQQGQMQAWVGFCSLIPPRTDAWGGGQCRWDPPLMLRPRGA